MCAACQAEYDDPRDRRFHAQPNACPACGPAFGRRAASHYDEVSPRQALLSGAILAVKGVGGFHLACRADHEAAVARLRARKHREDRPFAVMVGDVATAAALVEEGVARFVVQGAPNPGHPPRADRDRAAAARR